MTTNFDASCIYIIMYTLASRSRVASSVSLLALTINRPIVANRWRRREQAAPARVNHPSVICRRVHWTFLLSDATYFSILYAIFRDQEYRLPFIPPDSNWEFRRRRSTHLLFFDSEFVPLVLLQYQLWRRRRIPGKGKVRVKDVCIYFKRHSSYKFVWFICVLIEVVIQYLKDLWGFCLKSWFFV